MSKRGGPDPRSFKYRDIEDAGAKLMASFTCVPSFADFHGSPAVKKHGGLSLTEQRKLF
jgi:hypothetical protein